MAKYRLLNNEELKGLEKEFIEYLVLNGIAADDWLKMKTNETENANQIIDLFSDVVFEKILRGIKHLEIYETKSVRSFKCDQEEIEMIIMEVEYNGADFNNPDFIAKAMTNPPEDLLIYKTEKPYQKAREAEIFEMIEKGCLISNGKLHQTLGIALDQL